MPDVVRVVTVKLVFVKGVEEFKPGSGDVGTTVILEVVEHVSVGVYHSVHVVLYGYGYERVVLGPGTTRVPLTAPDGQAVVVEFGEGKVAEADEETEADPEIPVLRIVRPPIELTVTPEVPKPSEEPVGAGNGDMVPLEKENGGREIVYVELPDVKMDATLRVPFGTIDPANVVFAPGRDSVAGIEVKKGAVPLPVEVKIGEALGAMVSIVRSPDELKVGNGGRLDNNPPVPPVAPVPPGGIIAEIVPLVDNIPEVGTEVKLESDDPALPVDALTAPVIPVVFGVGKGGRKENKPNVELEAHGGRPILKETVPPPVGTPLGTETVVAFAPAGRDMDAEPTPGPKVSVALINPVPNIVKPVAGPLNGSVELEIGKGTDSEVIVVSLPEVIVANDKLPVATPVELKEPLPGTEDGRTVDIPVPAPDIVPEPIAGKVELGNGNVTSVRNLLEETVKLNVGNGGGNVDPVVIVALALPLIGSVVGKRGPEAVEAVPVVEERELYPAEAADAPVPATVLLIMADEFPGCRGEVADSEAVPVPEVTPLGVTLPETERVPLDEETVPGRAEVERVSPLDAAPDPPVGNGSAVEFPPGYGGEIKLEGGLDRVAVPEEMAAVREPEEIAPKLEVTGALPKPMLELPSGYDAEDKDGVVPDGGLKLGVPERLIVSRDPETVKTEKDQEANGSMEEPVGPADPVPFVIEYGAELIEEDPIPMLEDPEEVAACADVPVPDGVVITPVDVPVILLNVSVFSGVAVLVAFALVDTVDLEEEFVKVRLPLAGMLLIAKLDLEVTAAVELLENNAVNVELVPSALAVPAPEVMLATELARVSVKLPVELDAIPAGVDPGDSVPPVAIELVATDPVDPAAVPLLGNGGRGTVPEKVSTESVPPAPVTVGRGGLGACVAEDPEPVTVPEVAPDDEPTPVTEVGYAAELEPDWSEDDDPDTTTVLALPEAAPEKEEPDAPPEELIPEAVEAPRLDPVPGPVEPLAADEDKALPVTAAVLENPEITLLVWVTVVVREMPEDTVTSVMTSVVRLVESGIVKEPLSKLRVVAEEAPDDRLAGAVTDAPVTDGPAPEPVAELAERELSDTVNPGSTEGVLALP
ncbi:hypothetical protein DL769_003998 [Monosporascus sp. CRB-8-3]|nr:hypothetical protein DL769_003998 [Monosporascus sp. CRB-8-3]